MKRYPDHLVRQARRLAISKELSYVEIGKTLGVPNGTVSTWCQDLAASRFRGLIKYNEKKRNELLDSEKGVVDKVKLDEDNSKLFCALLHGCEGAKYPATNGVSLTNSDPDLVVAFVKLLRQGFVLDQSKWRVHLQIHDDQDFPKLVKYWSELLDIPGDNFFKPTVTHARGGKHRNKYFGTCSVRYGDYKIQLKLIGVFKEFLRKLGSQGGVA